MMKRVRINKGKVGLVFRNDDYKKVLMAGSYWVRFTDKVGICNMSQAFTLSMELNILLQDEELASMLEVVEVLDHEIVLKYENGVFNEVLKPGRYAYWKGATDYIFKKLDLSKVEITEDLPINILYKPEIYPYVRIYRVESYEKGLLFVDDKMIKELNQGVYYFWKNNTSILVMKADMRQTQLEISGQELLTKDKAAIRISFFATYKVVDAIKALCDNQDYKKTIACSTSIAVARICRHINA